LQEITEREISVDDQAAEILNLRLDLPHGIEWTSKGLKNPESFTCGMQVFGFEKWAEYKSFAQDDIFAGCDFYTWLLKNKKLCHQCSNNVCVDDLILYFTDQPRWEHVGRLQSRDRVRSKWGKGHIYIHQIWEVPSRYGDNARFFRSITDQDAQALFREFASQ
jgi:hypothetical protein